MPKVRPARIRNDYITIKIDPITNSDKAIKATILEVDGVECDEDVEQWIPMTLIEESDLVDLMDALAEHVYSDTEIQVQTWFLKKEGLY